MQEVNGSIPFSSTISCGGIAQLGEHLLCKQRVYGSIPYTSTMTTKALRLYFFASMLYLAQRIRHPTYHFPKAYLLFSFTPQQ